MLSDIEYKKLAWHSRRGMRELDLLLLPFVESVLPSQALEVQQLYQRFLQEEDQDLYNWLVLRDPDVHPAFIPLIQLIRQGA